jgi:hypothetical protein
LGTTRSGALFSFFAFADPVEILYFGDEVEEEGVGGGGGGCGVGMLEGDEGLADV